MKTSKRIAALLLSLVLVSVGTACGDQNPSAAASTASVAGNSQQAEDSEIMNMPNPWVEAADQQEAEQQAGFSITLPQNLPQGYGEPSFQVIPGEIMEAYYAGAGEARLCIRKAVGTEDTSGDYHAYTESQLVMVGNLEVTMKGGDGKINLAVWQDGANAYSIGIYGGAGITVEEMTQLVTQMMDQAGN